jgi:hypothetical protein
MGNSTIPIPSISNENEEKKKKAKIKRDQNLLDFEEMGGLKAILREIFNPKKS